MVRKSKFTFEQKLKEAVTEYIDYYNNHRYQARLNCMAPLEYREYLNTVNQQKDKQR